MESGVFEKCSRAELSGLKQIKNPACSVKCADREKLLYGGSCFILYSEFKKFKNETVVVPFILYDTA